MIMLACMAMAVPTIVLQHYMLKATGKLTKVEQSSDISDHKPTKYYALKKYYLDKKHIGIYRYAGFEGSKKRTFHMRMYIVIPLLDNISDTGWQAHRYWLAVDYDQTTQGRLEGKALNDAFILFSDKVMWEIHDTDFEQFEYLEVMGNKLGRNRFKDALEHIGQETGRQIMIFKSRSGPFEERARSSLKGFLLCLFISPMFYFLILLMHRFKKKYPNYPVKRKTRLWRKRS